MSTLKKVAKISFVVFVIALILGIAISFISVRQIVEDYNSLIDADGFSPAKVETYSGEAKTVSVYYESYVPVSTMPSPDEDIHIEYYDVGIYTAVGLAEEKGNSLTITLDRQPNKINEEMISKLIASEISNDYGVKIYLPDDAVYHDERYYSNNVSTIYYSEYSDFSSAYFGYLDLLNEIDKEKRDAIIRGLDKQQYLDDNSNRYKELADLREEILIHAEKEYYTAEELEPYKLLTLDLTIAEQERDALEVSIQYETMQGEDVDDERDMATELMEVNNKVNALRDAFDTLLSKAVGSLGVTVQQNAVASSEAVPVEEEAGTEQSATESSQASEENINTSEQSIVQNS